MKKSVRIVSICLFILTSCSVVSKNGYRQSRKYNLSKVHFSSGNKNDSKASKSKTQTNDSSYLASLHWNEILESNKQNKNLTSNISKKVELPTTINTTTNDKSSYKKSKQDLANILLTHKNDNAKFGAEMPAISKLHKSKLVTKNIKLKSSTKTNSAASPLFTTSILYGISAIILYIVLVALISSSALNSVIVFLLLAFVLAITTILAFVLALIGLPGTLQESYSFIAQVGAVLWTIIIGIVAVPVAIILYDIFSS
jgi:multidrug efflux pump subunit AcrB